MAEKIIPAADVSEQISTAGTEASGTGNMKFAMNGALTIGTLDGANVEIREEVGDENIFIFGLTAEAIAAMRASGSYDPRRYYESDLSLRRVLDALASDRFCPGEPGSFKWIPETLLRGDNYFVIADFAVVRRDAGQDCPRVPRTRAMDAQSYSQCRAGRLLLQRPHGARIRSRYLGPQISLSGSHGA